MRLLRYTFIKVFRGGFQIIDNKDDSVIGYVRKELSAIEIVNYMNNYEPKKPII